MNKNKKKTIMIVWKELHRYICIVVLKYDCITDIFVPYVLMYIYALPNWIPICVYKQWIDQVFPNILNMYIYILYVYQVNSNEWQIERKVKHRQKK